MIELDVEVLVTTACEGLLALNTANSFNTVPVDPSFGISKSLRPNITELNDVFANTLFIAFPLSLPRLNWLSPLVAQGLRLPVASTTHFNPLPTHKPNPGADADVPFSLRTTA
jgi:hypothetical protein